MLQKLGVNIILLSPHVRSKLQVIDEIFLKWAGREAIITSGNDGQHMVGSFHYRWRAIDLRTRDLTKEVREKVWNELNKKLNESGHLFDILLESDHIHIEFDPK